MPDDVATPAGGTQEATATPETAGEQEAISAPQATEAASGERSAGDAAEPFAIAAPEGMDAYASDYESFSADMDGWLKENPEATPRQALERASQYQLDKVRAEADEAVSAFNAQVEAWETEVSNDPEIGGDKFDETAAAARSAVEKLGTPALAEALQESGLGSHPEIIRMLAKANSLMADASVATSGSGSGKPRKSITSALYGSQNG